MSTLPIANDTGKIDLDSLKKTRLNIAVFGCGNVGATFIDQLIAAREQISRRKDLECTIFAIANSKKVLLEVDGVDVDWRSRVQATARTYTVSDIVAFARQNDLDNLVAIDNTASEAFTLEYKELIVAGFHLVAANKIANTTRFRHYSQLRELLAQHHREFFYETNVGAGLPLIDTIKLLHLSGENITRIRGVFSGSLSYIFNTFSTGDRKFSDVVRSAMLKGYTEPDPRIDLSGKDVGRKLLILARELALYKEFEHIQIQNLIPDELRTVPPGEFVNRLSELDVPFHIKRKNLQKDQVLRYVADLHGDLSTNEGGILEVKLDTVHTHSVLGQLKGSDTIFEIFTENYGSNPIVIQGAGAGAEVTARGVLGDVLRLGAQLKSKG